MSLKQAFNKPVRSIKEQRALTEEGSGSLGHLTRSAVFGSGTVYCIPITGAGELLSRVVAAMLFWNIK